MIPWALRKACTAFGVAPPWALRGRSVGVPWAFRGRSVGAPWVAWGTEIGPLRGDTTPFWK